ncbi:MAG: hypothetical protein KJN77_06760 [Gammaproteobacteria bacterium]|nr:hypothetical protein [Gammaproteobacteria bacterium]
MLLIPRLIVLSLLLAAAPGRAQVDLPEDLEGWQQWVLKDKEYVACPHYFDHAAESRNDFVCSWPGLLELSVSESGARFSQQWSVYATEQWITLPGGTDAWPEQVLANDRALAVVLQNGAPSVRLAPGGYEISGRFRWDERPGILRIAPASGLISLTVDGRKIARPEMHRDGLYLGERQRDSAVVDSVVTVVHRLIGDEVPARLITRLQIDVAGSVREEVFGPVLPGEFVPLSIQSPLPARLEADGQLRLQVRPGRWTVYLAARGPSVVETLTRADPGANMPANEIWSYQSNDRLRVTVAEGLPPVDPRQVQVPDGWNNLPAFRADAGTALTIKERSRGIVSASNELGLARTLWLDFDGAGFVVRDKVSGSMQSDWRLDMSPPYSLLSASEASENLLVTKGAGEGQTGVELRRTRVDLDAIGRSETRGEMPVTGWDSRFASVKATLHLPPGHKLLAASGVDVARGSWMSQWQLLDFFLVLIISIGVWRLLGRVAAVIALLALTLSFHELFAPSWVWLNLLVAVALMRVAPPGRLRQLVGGYQLLSAAALVLTLVPFVAGQLRIALYPQLEPQYNEYQLYDFMTETAPSEAVVVEDKEISRLRRAEMVTESPQLGSVTAGAAKTMSFARYAPNAIVQAGPGIPSWQWNSYALTWSGPVDAAQSMKLIVLPRWLVSALRVVEVLLLLLFAAALAAEVFKKSWRLPGGLRLGAGQTASLTSAVIIALSLSVSPTAEADIPDAGMLQQLQQRLLQPPDCVPRCAEIVAADVEAGADTISMVLTVHALDDVALPLPGSREGWHPDAVVVDGDAGTKVLRGDDGHLYIEVMEGRRNVTVSGPVPGVDSLEIPFPTPPRVVTVQAEGWFVSGVKDRHLLSGSMQLTRLQNDADGQQTVRWESSRFPAFARIERTIELDLDWRVTTTVQRVAPLEGAMTLDVPLIEGESIVSGDFEVRDGRVLVSLGPEQRVLTWTSNLPRRSPLLLTAEASASWHEVWRFAVGNIWHADFEGLPESDAGSDTGNVRIAEFNPRAGESLTLRATRPEASAGSTLAFDAVRVNVQHGNRSSDASLLLNYRSTRGAQHVVRLPADAEVTAVVIDGRPQTLRAENAELSLPILPGEHTVQVDWRADGGMGLVTATPDVDIGAPASNIELSLTQPRDRWLLATSGPQLGPAVLYWSELAVLVLFAFILGRIGLAPLKSWHWLLLGIGFSTFSWPALGLVVAWLLACGVREKWRPEVDWWRFNLIQVVIGGLTVIALLVIISTLPSGLLGTPDMHVSGHNSMNNVLGWFADRSESSLPVAEVFTLPLWIYKALILAWALWLSFALLRWLPWVWQCFSSEGYWRSRRQA